MRKRLLPTGLIAFFLLSLLASCALRPDVVGQWQRVDGESTLEFREDGTFAAVDNLGATVMGPYTLHADGTLYYAVTHTDIMQATLIPVEDFEVHIAGLKFRHFKVEIAVATDDGTEIEIYRRADKFPTPH